MLTYIARRLLVAVPTLLGVATVVFSLLRLLPANTAVILAAPTATPETIQHIREQLGLTLPLWEQYLGFLGRLAHGDLGDSTRTGAPVVQEILTRAPFTVELAVSGVVMAIAIGGAAGVFAATRRNTGADVGVSGAAVFGVSMPTYWLGMMLIIVFAVQLRWLPAGGADRGAISLILPAITLALFS